MSARARDIFFRLALCVVLLTATIIPIFQAKSAYAAQLSPRTLTLEAGASDGGSKPGGVVKHYFSFTIPTGGNVGSIEFKYCMISVGTCDMPTGLVTTSATLDNETGATGFSMVNTTNGSPYITRTAANVVASTAVTYRLGTITNPTTANQSFFVRITTYTDANKGGSAVDTGSVTASTATQIVLTGIMPESIVFCTGATVEKTGGVPDCSTASAGTISFNQLFSPSDTATATSQMVASTNSSTGYTITVNGPTLTSGSNTIDAMGSSGPGVRGTSQFGMNLKLNTTGTSNPAVGAEIDPSSGAGDGGLKGVAATGYGTVDEFKFTTGDTVATSTVGGAGPTNPQIYTVSYIVNVDGIQPSGTYVSTLTYICTATF